MMCFQETRMLTLLRDNGMDVLLENVRCHICGWVYCPHLYGIECPGCVCDCDCLDCQREELERWDMEAEDLEWELREAATLRECYETDYLEDMLKWDREKWEESDEIQYDLVPC